MKEVTVIDSMMGTGKTTALIDYMNDSDEKFIYITPYLNEVERVIENCSMRYFVQPKKFDTKKLKGVSKYEDMLEILDNEFNVASTHALFKTFNTEILEALDKTKYTLIMDEVVDVVELLKISKDDIRLLMNDGVIEIKEDNRINWIKDDYVGKFSSYKDKIKNGEVYLHDNTAILWTFPCEIFKHFDKIIISTYLFRGQIQCYYYQVNGIQFKYKSAESYIDNNGNKKYRICDYIKNEDLTHIKELINLYEGKLNDIGNRPKRSRRGKSKEPLCSGWYDNATKEELMVIKNNTYNYFRHKCKKKSKDVIWTTIKDRGDIEENPNKVKVIPNSYKNSFVTCTCRATNEYKDRDTVAYLLNRFENPILLQFLKSKGAVVDNDTFALSELIQFVWRSCIRDGKPINLYLPSERMRMLLIKWLLVKIKQNENKV